MPTLNKRENPSAKIHPRQTDYFIKAKPPEVGFITYQIDKRAVEFLTETCGYRDGDQLPWAVVHPLRQIRDLYTLDEGHPRKADPDEDIQREIDVPSVDKFEIDHLIGYLANHPDVAGDVGNFRTQIERGDTSFVAELRRDGYTPIETPGFDSTANENLDRIAQQYFGDDTGGSITWNGEYVSEYIEVTDRAGDTHQFPKINERLPEGELYRLSQDLYTRWGQQIGESEVISRRYEPDESGFPNPWIGQREGSPEPSLEQADSPRAFYYRTIAGRGGYAPGTEAKEAFEAACEYSLEVYKANFPTAVGPNDLTTEYVTVEEANQPWHDFQVPPGWIEKYADNDGVPPLKRTESSSLSAQQRAVLDRHSPNGEGFQWFASREEGVEFLKDEFYAGVLIAADQIDLDIVGFARGGAAQPTFELDFGELRATAVIEETHCRFQFESPKGAEITFSNDGQLPSDVTVQARSVSAAADISTSVKQNLTAITEFAKTVLDAAA
jgi:hypothetical protein